MCFFLIYFVCFVMVCLFIVLLYYVASIRALLQKSPVLSQFSLNKQWWWWWWLVMCLKPSWAKRSAHRFVSKRCMQMYRCHIIMYSLGKVLSLFLKMQKYWTLHCFDTNYIFIRPIKYKWQNKKYCPSISRTIWKAMAIMVYNLISWN